LAARVLVVQDSLVPPGGSQGVAAWVLQALQGRYSVTLLTGRVLRLAEVNRAYGTDLDAAALDVRHAGGSIDRLLDVLPFRLALLRKHLLLRSARSLAADFDVTLWLENEADLGCPGIQYVHYPWAFLPRPAVEMRWYHPRLLLGAYYRTSVAVSGFTVDGMRRNVTMVNSDWTGKQFTDWYGVETVTVPPPAVFGGEGRPWEEREDAFLCIGRFAPEKRLEQVIATLARVRAAGPRVRLVLVGGGRRSSYSESMRRLAARHADWVSIREEVSRQELDRLIATHRYGIHAMEDEHFGMAVAEMVRGGCVVFAHRSGGTPEIVGNDERLLWRDVDQAVMRILAVITDAGAQSELRGVLAQRSDRYAPAQFVAAIRAVVDERLATRT
jgi:glycosyltransferase involved in cell wall biosynthesis